MSKEIQYFKEDGSKHLDPDDFCTLHKTIAIIGDLLLITKSELGRFQQSIDAIIVPLLQLMKDDKTTVDTAFSDIVLNILKIEIAEQPSNPF